MNHAVLEEKLVGLHELGVKPEVIAAMRTYIASASEPRLQQMSAYRMADEWRLPRAEVLAAFLYGTR